VRGSRRKLTAGLLRYTSTVSFHRIKRVCVIAPREPLFPRNRGKEIGGRRKFDSSSIPSENNSLSSIETKIIPSSPQQIRVASQWRFMLKHDSHHLE